MPAHAVKLKAPASVERAVAVQLVGRDRAVTPAELYASVRAPGSAPTAIDTAIETLIAAGVVRRDEGGGLYATPAFAMLDALAMVAV
jgi:hypothetical protein